MTDKVHNCGRDVYYFILRRHPGIGYDELHKKAKKQVQSIAELGSLCSCCQPQCMIPYVHAYTHVPCTRFHKIYLSSC